MRIEIDTRDLDRLARTFGVAAKTHSRIVGSAFRDAVPTTSKTARAVMNRRGNYPSAGLAGVVNRSVKGRMTGTMTATISSTAGWPSLARFSAVKDPRGDYTRREYGGVTVNHFGVRKFDSKNSAFIRRGASGNVLVFERHGDKLKALSPINPAHVLHHHETFDAAGAAFSARMLQRYESKLFGALSRFK